MLAGADPGRKFSQDPVSFRILHRILVGLHNKMRLTGSYTRSCYNPIMAQVENT